MPVRGAGRGSAGLGREAQMLHAAGPRFAVLAQAVESNSGEEPVQ